MTAPEGAVRAHLDYLDELIVRDAAAADALGELDGLLASVAGMRERADVVTRELELGPAEIERRAGDVAAAEAGRAEACSRVELATRAEQDARQSADPLELREAARNLTEARDSAHIAEQRFGEATAALRVQQEQLAAAELERPELEEGAGALAEQLAGVPRLPGTVADAPERLVQIPAWSVETRAALVVARAAAVREREHAIREAGEIGALVTGAPVAAGSIATVATLVRTAASAC